MSLNPAQRIEALIQANGLNAKSFSEMLGYDRPQVVYDLLNGRTRNVSSSMANRILNVFPDVDRIWLLTGKGEMLRRSDMAAEPYLDHYVPSAPEVSTVPLVPISAIAGPLTAYYESGVDLNKCPRILSPTPGAELAIPITGDSMEPVFADGSTVFIKRINEAAFIPWGHPMVLDTENGIFIKTVMPDDSDPTFIWAESINPRYPRMHIPKRSIAGIYRVLNVTKSFATM